MYPSSWAGVDGVAQSTLLRLINGGIGGWYGPSYFRILKMIRNNRSFARVDQTGKTSRPGVFAVGNASNPIAHLAHATAEGTNVGPHVTNYLLEAKVTELRAQKQKGPE